MKTLFVFLSLLLSVSSQAQIGAPKRIFECDSNTDPDSVVVNVISAYGKTYAAIYEETGDGEVHVADMIELKYSDTGSDSSRTYLQVAGSKPAYPGMKMSQPTRKTRGVRLTIGLFGGRSTISAKVDPTGSPLAPIEMTCKTIVNASAF